MNPILTLLLLLLLAAPSVAASQATRDSPSYIILIDAGSSGSRIHVHTYYWTAGEVLPTIEPSQAKKITPGLSSFASNPEGAAAHIESLVSFARTIVPDSERSMTPIHLQATAGMRSIEAEQANAILTVARAALSATGFLFDPSWCLIISGEQEGINGWLATNYLLGTFADPDPMTDALTHGVVEMGGSSMQITFVPINPSPNHVKRLYSLPIAGRTYPLYTHSFLQYGLQAAEKLFQSIAIDAIEKSGNPCYPTGLKHSATGNFGECVKLMKSLVDRNRGCDYESCSFHGIYQPTIDAEPFLAIENFFYTAQFFGHVDQQQGNIHGSIETGAPLMNALRKAGEEYCELTWEQILDKHGDKSEQNKLAYYCFAAAYESAVLEEGFGFGERSNLRPAKTIKSKPIDWELGAALLQIINGQQYKDITVTHGPAVHHSQTTPEVLKPRFDSPSAALQVPTSALSPLALEASNCMYLYFFGLLFASLASVWIWQALRKPGNFNASHWNTNSPWNKV